VVEDADVTIITRRDAEDVVVMPLSTWNSWQETEYLLTSPANARLLRESIAQLNAGKGVVRQLIEPTATSRVAEPPPSPYGSKKTVAKKHAKRRG
jgi:antitoxin YefM